MKINLNAFLLVFLIGFTAFAQDAAVVENNVDIKIRARKRLYPGGRDEEPLKVQAQLVNPSRKMGPTIDNPANEPAEPQDND